MSKYFGGTPSVISDAFEIFTDLCLYIPPERDVRSKLSIVTTDSDPCKSKAKDRTKIRSFTRYRRLYQCQCGADNHDGRHASEDREMGWENVGCGAWYRLTSTHDTPDKKDKTTHYLLTIDEIIGDFNHSPQCIATTVMSRDPHIPFILHSTPLPQLKTQCREFSRNQWNMEVGDTQYRFVLSDYETTSLYRTLAQESGIPQRSAPENNLDLWFRKSNPMPPDPRLTAACLSYTPCIPGQSDRFSIILSTPEQRLLAWKYGHRKQMLMDLTFGVCNGRALLAILMVLDDQQKGLPVAFMLFTAKKSTKAVHADYTKELMSQILGQFKEGMGTNESGEEFEPEVGGTDNDARERHGLRHNWAEIWLLLCIFHVWQAWRNGLNKYLRVIPKGPDRQAIRKRLAKFLMRLLKEINLYDDAIAAYNEELDHAKKLSKARTSNAKSQSKGALAFLTYLQGYLKARDMWMSWSLAGAEEAAKRMGIPLSHVARTTNPLESFNGRLKGVYFAQYQHSGRLPRIDVWVLTMITKVMPELLESWAEKRKRKKFYQNMRHAAPKPQSAAIPRAPATPQQSTALNITHAPKQPAAPSPVSLTTPIEKSTSVQQLNDRAHAWLHSVLSVESDSTSQTATTNAAERMEKLEADLMQQMAADDAEDAEDAADVEGDDALEDFEAMEDFGASLVVDADGEGSFCSNRREGDLTEFVDSDVEMPDSPIDEHSFLLSDIALDNSDIIKDLPPDVSLEFPFSLAQPRDTSDNDDWFHPSLIHPPPSASPSSHSSSLPHTPISLASPRLPRSAATLRNDINNLEDQLARALQDLLDLGTEPQFLAHHISPSIAMRLDQITPEQEEPPSPPQNSAAALPEPFDLEKKKKRFQSHTPW
ncbi:hypothetical protein C8R47DRAFT_1207449 [Mycena vitilis]|nr:hypothetical protein C8R47DRAFT_1207449 [Mycena vitilis]